MRWARDDAKLERVRELIAEEGLDALVVRAPDNVLYLTNFWGMKGYDACVFPREGEPVLICLEASAEDAERMSWTKDVRLVQGLISDAGKLIAAKVAEEGWYEVATLKEPYRIEGKKTMGYELWEEFGGTLPDVIVYPTGGGVGLIGMWKAFEEVEDVGEDEGNHARGVGVDFLVFELESLLLHPIPHLVAAIQ